jgi:general secretion pathway protein G
MQILAICPHAKHIRAYTLLELLVVLVLLSLLTGLILPRLSQVYDSLQVAYTREEIISRLSSLSYSAYQRGRGFELIQYPLPKNAAPIPLELPAGWSLTTDVPIIFRANGACTGGTVSLYYQSQQVRIQLFAPFCTPR